MNTTILILILIINSISLLGQEKEVKYYSRPLNNIGINLLGDCSIIAVNYERLIPFREIFFIGKLGIGSNVITDFSLGGSGKDESILTIPHHFAGNIGKRKHLFEFGFGGTLLIGNITQHYILYPIIAYRIQPMRHRKAFVRLYFNMPITHYPSYQLFDYIFISYFGFCIGGSI